MAKQSKRPVALFQLRKLGKIGNFILKVRTIVLNIADHASIFVSPSPALAGVTTDVDNLEKAQSKANTRVTGSAAARDLDYDNVLIDVRGLLCYVQLLADKSVDEATAISIIQASGFDLRNKGVRVKPPLAAKNGDTNGQAKLVAKSAGKRASYRWQQSVDGIVWTDLPVTLQAKTVVNELSAGSKMFFRFRAILKEGEGNWSEAVTIIIL